jgi:hypothetical protein
LTGALWEVALVNEGDDVRRRSVQPSLSPRPCLALRAPQFSFSVAHSTQRQIRRRTWPAALREKKTVCVVTIGRPSCRVQVRH